MSGEGASGAGAKRRGRMLVGIAVAASVALIGAYLAAGGSSYAPAKTQDPCKPRPWRNPEGIEQLAQQLSLSALDGAACELGVSRETLATALASPQARDRFARERGITTAQLARAIRAGLLRAIDDAEEAGALSPLIAIPLRETVQHVPIDELIRIVNDASALLNSLQSLLGPAQGLLEEFLP